jgi:hypothetical protein
MPAASSILRHIPHPQSSKQISIIQPPGVKWVVSLLQLKLGYSCEIFTPRFQPQETNKYVFLGSFMSMTVLSHQAHMIGLLATNRDLLGELGIIMNFNDHTITWDTDK